MSSGLPLPLSLLSDILIVICGPDHFPPISPEYAGAAGGRTLRRRLFISPQKSKMLAVSILLLLAILSV